MGSCMAVVKTESLSLGYVESTESTVDEVLVRSCEIGWFAWCDDEVAVVSKW